jgi:diguanylate cyclase (GGDEF)-like protein/PAS domain S-box-containing protein
MSASELESSGNVLDRMCRGQPDTEQSDGDERFRELFESAPLAIGISDVEGIISAINPAFTRMLGYTLEDVPTLPIVLERFYPDPEYRASVYAEWIAAMEEHRRTGLPCAPATTRVRCKNGGERVAEIRSAISDGGTTIVMLTDITEQVQANEDRVHAELARAKLMGRLMLQSSRMPMALVLTDAGTELTIREWNPGAERIFGFTAEETVGRSPFGLIIPHERKSFVQALAGAHVDERETVRVVNENITKSGRRIWCEWFNTPVCDTSGKIVAMMSMAEDISERLKGEERMKLWSSVLDHTSEGILICDAQLRIVLINAAFTVITGYSQQEAAGQTPRILQSGRHESAFYADMWKTIRDTGCWQGELWNRNKAGEIYPERLAINAVRDELGHVTHYVGIIADITAHKATEQRIRHLAQYDALTDLPNRTLLADRLSQMVSVAARENGKGGALFIDLDHFKDVNDSMGHDAGDILLVAIAGRLRQCVREVDTVARMGGDEFVVLIGQLREPEDAADVAQKLLDAIKEPLVLHDNEVTVSASIGICIFPDDGAIASRLIHNADAAMYEAKSAGRNTFCFYTRGMNVRALQRLSTETALRRAIAEHEFVLHYQPLVDIGSGEIIGAEALIRWNRPGVGMVPPLQFIPIAEQRGLIIPIGTWALDEAARQAAAWEHAGISIPIAVNLSALQFHQKGFVERVAETIASHRIEPSRIDLELTESIIVHDAAATITLLERLHDIGVALSIDDFGTGYSSLNYLRRFPIDKIKIDKSFIDEIVEHQETARVVGGIIALAKALDLKVVAEGVETPQQLEILRSEGCHQAQGYLFSRPLPAADFDALFRRGAIR